MATAGTDRFHFTLMPENALCMYLSSGLLRSLGGQKGLRLHPDLLRPISCPLTMTGSRLSSEILKFVTFAVCGSSPKGLDSNPSRSCLILAHFQFSVDYGACRQGWSDLFTSGQLKVCQKQKIACSRQKLSAARTKFPG